MKFKTLFLLFLILLFSKTEAQTSTQTIRGIVVDKISQSPLPGATIQMLSPDLERAVSTDANGKFELKNIPIGKQSLKISFLGYKDAVLRDLSVDAGKELVLNISLEEDIKQIKEIAVTDNSGKNKPLNTMSTVSTRTFSVEETQKFAAALNDPARMATSFPGVVQPGDGNEISIRGNSPNGLLWRMEGVDIPNPNHFSSVGSSGGGISILSAQLLSNSDFSTGAFAAEYGNALSGVFDLKLRKGNNERREYTIQLGVLGADISTEGPFKKGYDGSYLINYRYSSLLLMKRLGLPIGDATTNFQDLSFNISLPTKKIGTFGIFGFGGLSYQYTEAKKDSTKWTDDDFTRLNTHFYSNTGAVGLTNTKLFKNQSYLRTAFVFSGTQNGYSEERMNSDYATFIKQYEEKHTQNKITLSTSYTKKISAKNNIRTGFIINELYYNLNQKDIADTTILIDKINVKGNTQTLQLFFQWNYKLTSKLTTNIGVHYLQLFLNNTYSIEPRASFRYEISSKHAFTFGYGLHSQIQPIGVYFAKELVNGNYMTPNKNLAMSKAQHFVFGYDFNINDFSHIKTEVYYQYLFNIPISNDTGSTYSIINETDGYTTNALTNKGLGQNYGLELSYERSLYKDFYYLLSVSIFDSKYKAANNNWYNTRFNTNYAGSISLGKEWTLSEKRKSRIIGFNVKVVYVGGLRYTPIDLPASIIAGETRYVDSETFKNKNPDYFRPDIRISLKRNYKRLTSTLALDVQNIANRKNVGGQYFDSKTGKIKYYYQSQIIPLLSYRLEF
jgi:hypothetical protein